MTMTISLDEATSQVNNMPFPAAAEGDMVWLEGYEFLLVGELWVYNERYRNAETNEIVVGYPSIDSDGE